MEYLQLLGLFLDVIGVGLLIKYGHALFIYARTTPVPEKLPSGTLYIQYEGDASDKGDHHKRLRLARCGVWLVFIGFATQLIVAVAAIL